MDFNLAPRLKSVQVGFDRVRAQRVEAANRLSVLEKSVGEAKYRLSLKDEVEEVILDLQERNHKRTVGMYESLLTQILREVLNNQNKSVALDLGTRAGKPTLDIMVKSGDDLEDVMTGSGGSVANIISAGLRFIALSRVDCRKFIVLDEADCWLSPDRIGQFSNVVSRMGDELGVQSIMISHHDAGSFYDAASTVVYLSRDMKTNSVMVEHHKQAQSRVGPKDIALIELRDFMSHADTKIKVGPGMTVIHGANDIGKSAVVTALHAISEASFKKDYVRHGAESGFVRLTLGDGHTIELQRSVKGSPAMIYRLYEPDGTMAHESPVKNEVPGWAEALIGIRLEQDLDIQLGNQKRPVFLLDEPDSKKTAILSVGGELSHLVAMQEKYKAWVSTDKLKVKEGELEVGRLRDEIKLSDDLLAVECVAAVAERSLTELTLLQSQDALVSALVLRLAQSLKLLAVACEFDDIQVAASDCRVVNVDRLVGVLSGLHSLAVPGSAVAPLLPVMEGSVVNADKLIGVLSGLRSLAAPGGAVVPQLPVMGGDVVSADALLRIIASLRIADRRVIAGGLLDVMDKTLSIELCHVEDADKLLSLIGRMKVRASTGKVVAQNEAVTAKELVSLGVEYDVLVEKLGGVCPVCHGEMAGAHAHA